MKCNLKKKRKLNLQMYTVEFKQICKNLVPLQCCLLQSSCIAVKSGSHVTSWKPILVSSTTFLSIWSMPQWSYQHYHLEYVHSKKNFSAEQKLAFPCFWNLVGIFSLETRWIQAVNSPTYLDKIQNLEKIQYKSPGELGNTVIWLLFVMLGALLDSWHLC